jgi:hypothetical protein
MPTAVIGMFLHAAFPLYVSVIVIDERHRHADARWRVGPGRLRRDQRRAAEHLSSSYGNQRRVSAAKEKELLLDMIFWDPAGFAADGSTRLALQGAGRPLASVPRLHGLLRDLPGLVPEHCGLRGHLRLLQDAALF